MGFKKLSLLAPLLLLGAGFAGAGEPSQPSAHRFELARLGSHRFAIHSLPSAPIKSVTVSSVPNFTFFDMPSSTVTESGAINLGVGTSASHTVGCFTPNSAPGTFDGFEYTLTTFGKTSTATMKTIGPTNVNLCAYGINDSGEVTGVYAPSGVPAGVYDGFVLKGSKLTQVIAPFPGNCVTLPMGINDAGTVIGQYQTNTDCTSDHGWAEVGFTWSNGVFTLIPGPAGSIDAAPWAINSTGAMVGVALNATETAAIGWLLQNGVYTTINYPGAPFTVPTAINDNGDIVGYYCAGTYDDCNNFASPYIGFLYSGGTYTSFSVPGVPWSYPSGINNKGVIVGSYEDTNNFWHGFLIQP
jgi:uncharacterized membrane protein